MQNIERRTQAAWMELIVPLLSLIVAIVILVVVGSLIHGAFEHLSEILKTAQTGSQQ